ncbi:MAG: hypothetical protein KKD44_00865 [Proteobacteria bacterium]|nr:hypothetical protein [Pseudomonadota bacterium]
MKQTDYRSIVLLIIFLVSISISIKLFLSHPGPIDTALTINDKSISEKAFNKMFSKESRMQNKNEFIHSVIIKELLIQEALKAGIQGEESFRQSVQDFYEQSLIKIIMDRKYDSLNPDIDTAMVDRYIELSDKTLDLSLLTYKQPGDIVKGKIETKETISIPFNRLSLDVKFEVISIETGGISQPSYSEADQEYSVFQLDKIRESDTKTDKETDRDMIRQMLREQKKERLISKWLDELKEHAAITLGATVNQGEPQTNE